MSANTFAVQSWCFRHFKDNAKVAQLVKEIGLSNIEVCGAHANFNDESTFDSVIKTYKDAGVGIVSIGVEGLSLDEAAIQKRINFCKKAGAKRMSITFNPDHMPDNFALADKVATESGIHLAIHNHGGYDWLGSTRMLKYVFSKTQHVGLCLDTAWALAAGENPLKYVELAGNRLYSVHVKDFVFGRDRKPTDVVVGEGNINLTELRDALKKVSFAGPLILEYEGDVENPVPALTKCVEAMKKVF
ncbi:MAG: TIM barrel protein [Phycisphaera sp.]|nr:TIM barrel protein [Phycisphaera sp.]